MALDDYLVPVVRDKYKASICFDCGKACGRCSWSRYDDEKHRPAFEPVPGWVAEKVMLKLNSGHGKAHVTETYRVIECPEFEPEGERKSDYLMLTPDQSEAFVRNIKSILRKWCNEEAQQEA